MIYQEFGYILTYIGTNTYPELQKENMNYNEDNTINIINANENNIGINLRSTHATFLDISDSIRKIFANENKVQQNLFSFKSKGACPACGGKGIIISEMAFMDTSINSRAI